MSKHHRHHRSSEQEQESGDTQLMTAPAGENAAAGGENNDQAGGVMAAFQNARAFAGNVRQKAVAGARATDQAIQSNPYKALAIAAGVGLLLGLFLSRRGSRDA